LLIEQAKERIMHTDSTVTGFNIGINDGIGAGQTIMYCHVHVIPRRKGDVTDPRSGIRYHSLQKTQTRGMVRAHEDYIPACSRVLLPER
jgi:diadenosine tetraphosphate (Ap4A) HIT family hydrolase